MKFLDRFRRKSDSEDSEILAETKGEDWTTWKPDKIFDQDEGVTVLPPPDPPYDPKDVA